MKFNTQSSEIHVLADLVGFRKITFRGIFCKKKQQINIILHIISNNQQYNLISSSLTALGVNTPRSVNKSVMYWGGV